MKKGEGRLRNKADKELRAKAMMHKRLVEKQSIPQIAEQFNCSVTTVERALTFARRAELLVAEEDHILEVLVPKARAALLAALDSEDEEIATRVALEIYKGAGVLKRGGASMKTPAEAGDELSKYIERIRGERAVTVTEVARDEPKALPAVAETHHVQVDVPVREAELVSVPEGPEEVGEGSDPRTLEAPNDFDL